MEGQEELHCKGRTGRITMLEWKDRKNYITLYCKEGQEELQC